MTERRPRRHYPWRPVRQSIGGISFIDWAFISTYSGLRSQPLIGHWIGFAHSPAGIRGLSFAGRRRVWAFWVHRRRAM